MRTPIRGKPDLPEAPAPRPGQNFALDKDLRGYLKKNEDVVTVITKPVSIKNIGAIAAQSENPILFENIIEKPGFRIVDILVKAPQLAGPRARRLRGRL